MGRYARAVRPSISLVVPMYNEEESIEHAVGVATRALDEFASRHEIVIVDGGSQDGTLEALERWDERLARLRQVVLDQNPAVQEG